jgi:hypothetical protein
MASKLDDRDLFTGALALQGLDLPEARRAAVAQQLTRQIAAERTATTALEFEVEPATFFAVLEAGAK